MFECINCHQQVWELTSWRCPSCKGVLELSKSVVFNPQKIDSGNGRYGIWRYQPLFSILDKVPSITLGEGNTPLVQANLNGHTLYLKLEYLNPTGSYKDRGVAILISALKASGVQSVVEDSSGNAGASLAGYAARAGIKARIFVPAIASGPKQWQIAAYGAEVFPIKGQRSEATRAAQTAAQQGMVYASHVYSPLCLAGYATVAFELWEQLGQAPDTIILPIGHGTLLLGLHLGFTALVTAGLIKRLPRLVGVQPLACAPIWAALQKGQDWVEDVPEVATVAEGLRTHQPLRGKQVLAAIVESGGTVVAVDETSIIVGQKYFARAGFYIEATSAVIWEALKQANGITVAILTGSGLKGNLP